MSADFPTHSEIGEENIRQRRSRARLDTNTVQDLLDRQDEDLNT
jgi:hypothetical protein